MTSQSPVVASPFTEPRGIETPLVAYRKVAVTGHRPTYYTPDEAAWAQVALARAAWTLRSKYGTTTAISGMALGADTWWALAGLAAGMRLHAYIPFTDQPVKWPEADRALWRTLRARAEKEIVLGEHYRVELLHQRNDCMIDDADLMVAVWKSDVTKGGTFSAVTKIRRIGRPMLLVDPATRTITREGF
ncbi:hypothetical protein [Nocardioides pakistanensis]